MFVLLNGRALEVGERSAIAGHELRAIGAVKPEEDLWQVVPDPGAVYRESARPALPVHDERVLGMTMVRLGSNPCRVRRFFTRSRPTS